MAQSLIGPTSWIRLFVFSLLVVALAAVPVRGCARSDQAPDTETSSATTVPVEPD
jgi:hypothetical protein